MARHPSIRNVLGLVVLVLALVGHLWMHADHPLDSHPERDGGPRTAAHHDARAEDPGPAQSEVEPNLAMLVACLIVLSALTVSLLRHRARRSGLTLRLATPGPSRGSHVPFGSAGPPTPVAAGVLLRV